MRNLYWWKTNFS